MAGWSVRVSIVQQCGIEAGWSVVGKYSTVMWYNGWQDGVFGVSIVQSCGIKAGWSVWGKYSTAMWYKGWQDGVLG